MTATALFDVNLAAALAARAGAMVMAAPALGSRNIPVPVRVGLAIGLAALLYPLVPPPAAPPATVFGLAGLLLREIAVGLLLGGIGTLVLAGVLLAGELLDVQLGFGMAQLYDPMTQRPGGPVAQFYHLFALLLFFGTDTHLYLLAALGRSYQAVPAGALALSPAAQQRLIDLFRDVFPLALRIALPIVGVLLLLDLLLGFLSRTMPQLNVFAAGFAIKIAAGLALAAWTLPQLGLLLRDAYAGLAQQWLSLF